MFNGGEKMNLDRLREYRIYSLQFSFAGPAVVRCTIHCFGNKRENGATETIQMSAVASTSGEALRTVVKGWLVRSDQILALLDF